MCLRARSEALLRDSSCMPSGILIEVTERRTEQTRMRPSSLVGITQISWAFLADLLDARVNPPIHLPGGQTLDESLARLQNPRQPDDTGWRGRHYQLSSQKHPDFVYSDLPINVMGCVSVKASAASAGYSICLFPVIAPPTKPAPAPTAAPMAAPFPPPAIPPINAPPAAPPPVVAAVLLPFPFSVLLKTLVSI